MVCVCEVERERESECVCCLQGQGHREVGGGAWMSGGICACVCEENHHSSHQCARPALLPSLPWPIVPPLDSSGGGG